MESGKALVLKVLIATEKPFKVPHVVYETGLDRNLVRYHLTRFSEQGLLEKIGNTYIVRDKTALIDSLFHDVEKLGIRGVKTTPYISKERAEFFNHFVQGLIHSRILKVDDYGAMQASMNQAIDSTINEFKAMKKALNNSQPSPATGVKWFHSMDLDSKKIFFEALIVIGYESPVSSDKWIDNWNSAIERYEEDDK